MRRTLSALLAALVLLGVLGSSAWAAQSDQGETVSSGETEFPREAELPEMAEAPGEPEDQENPESPDSETDEDELEEEKPPTLEELRDTLFAILGGEEETQAIREQVNRMIVLGDPSGSVREWMELTIRKYQMEEELRKVASQLDGLETGDEALWSIAQAVEELNQQPDALLVSVEEISPGAAALLEGLAPEALEPVRAQLTQLLAYDGGTPSGRTFASVQLILAVRDSGLLDDAGVGSAQSALVEELTGLMEMCYSFTAGERSRLESASQNLARRANLAEAYSPAMLLPVGAELNYTNPLFTYNGAVMLSIPDALEFLGGELVEDGDMLAILAPDTVLELVKGSSDSYLNDKLCKLAAPVLNFDGVCYLPLDTVLRCRGMERLTVENHELIYYPIAQAETAENGGN